MKKFKYNVRCKKSPNEVFFVNNDTYKIYEFYDGFLYIEDHKGGAWKYEHLSVYFINERKEKLQKLSQC